MKDIIDKISSYNLFNYLFPGIIFVILLREITEYDLIQENNLIGIFLYYFIGLTISRVGSLLIGNLLRKITFIKFTDYTEYVLASDKDSKIELFSEVNNMYRTIISLFLLLLCSKLFQLISDLLNLEKKSSFLLIVFCLLILFVFSYKKQTSFIVKRVQVRNKK